MHKIPHISFPILLLILSNACKEAKIINKESNVFISYNIDANDLSKEEIDSIVQKYKDLRKEKFLEKYTLSDKSSCGGLSSGYYQDTSLLIIEARTKGELGFSDKTVYLYKGNIIRLKYYQHLAEWDKYEKEFPSERYVWDETKMTYTDTVYKVTFGKQYLLQKYVDNKLLATEQDSTIIEEYLFCALEMRNELRTERTLTK